MTDRIPAGALQVARSLHAFIEEEALPAAGIADAAGFWAGVSRIVADLTPVNRALLARRDELQAQIDAWHREHGAGDPDAYERVPHRDRLPGAGAAAPVHVDPGSTRRSPRSPARSWWCPPPCRATRSTRRTPVGARCSTRFYGTDALPQDHELAPGYDERRGAQVIAAADELLDELFPLAAAATARRHA